MLSEISIACKTIELISNSFSSTQQQWDTATVVTPALSTPPVPSHSGLLFGTGARREVFKYQHADLERAGHVTDPGSSLI